MFDGIDFNEVGALDLLSELDITGMDWQENTWFSRLDSVVLHGILRKYSPAKMIEVGSGYSTGIARAAFDGELICIDPAPRTGLPGGIQFLETRVENVNPGSFSNADVVFIDSSHEYKEEDVPFIFFQVLPVLKPGAVIHFHDIFLPFDYPPEWLDRHYDEQYLLGALMEGNPGYKVLWPAHLMVKIHGQELLERLGTPDDLSTIWGAGSFWIQKGMV
jgi:Methyltransferase domain